VIDWNEIVNKYGDCVWKTAFRILNNEHDTWDCFQQTFLDTLKYSKKKRISNYKALLTKIATNRALDKIRQKYRQKQLSINDQAIEANVYTNSPLKNSLNTELANTLVVAITQLSQHESEIFCLKFLNEMSYDQIAESMNIKKSNVGVSINRIKQKLQKLLSDKIKN
jgi:RNA polymerase sigma-70 factor (ECF subfamily)